MIKINKVISQFSDQTQAELKAKLLCQRWERLCEIFLPFKLEDSIWSYSRKSKPQEPTQGWKLHISATILEACDLFEKVAPFLTSLDVQFKAPKTLEHLSRLNSSLHHGYWQVGKFITVYPSNDIQAVELAKKLHELTQEFFPVIVPFDNQYCLDSSIFYRYGAYSTIEVTDDDGKKFFAIKNPSGEYVLDDRLKAYPDWVSNPFPKREKSSKDSFAGTPLGTSYRIFQAITQRGKGGTYQAVDLSQNHLRFCVVKEGRRNGDLAWNGQDGYFLVQNEFEVLKILKEKYDAVPQVFESFEVLGNFYFVMEFVEGKSLNDLIKTRRRRLPIKRVVELAVEIAKIIEKIHQAGWVWNDCKPANLIVTENGLRPIDFEGAYPIGESNPFDWKTQGFSSKSDGKSSDIYALGAVVYFLLTGRLYNADKPIAIGKLRRNVPPQLAEIVEKLLLEPDLDISEVRNSFEETLNLC